jgi:hypothetical protein
MGLRRESRERREGLRRKALLASAREINGVAQRVRQLPRAQLSRADTYRRGKRLFAIGAGRLEARIRHGLRE